MILGALNFPQDCTLHTILYMTGNKISVHTPWVKNYYTNVASATLADTFPQSCRVAHSLSAHPSSSLTVPRARIWVNFPRPSGFKLQRLIVTPSTQQILLLYVNFYPW